MKRIVFDDPIRCGEWACERMSAKFNPANSTAIGLEKDGQLVAAVVYDNYFINSIAMHVVIEDKACLTREAIKAVFDYPFNQLKVNVIVGLVDSANSDAIKFDEHLGFILETRIKNAHRKGDLLIYSMNKSQCKWVKK
jgi:RimJ/RimL family protein N-acetyltransferase